MLAFIFQYISHVVARPVLRRKIIIILLAVFLPIILVQMLSSCWNGKREAEELRRLHHVPLLRQYFPKEFTTKAWAIVDQKSGNFSYYKKWHSQFRKDIQYASNYGISGFMFPLSAHVLRDLFSVSDPRKLPGQFCFLVRIPNENSGRQQTLLTTLESLNINTSELQKQTTMKNYYKINGKPVVITERGKGNFTIHLIVENGFDFRVHQFLCPQLRYVSCAAFPKTMTNWDSNLEFQQRVAKSFRKTDHACTSKSVVIDSWTCLRGNHGNYGKMEALRMAMIQQEIRQKNVTFESPKIGIFIHAFYDDVFAEILSYLLLLSKGIRWETELYVATMREQRASAIAVFKVLSWRVHVRVYKNRGRDVLPFMDMLPEMLSKHNVIVKINTKKSVNTGTGFKWRRHIYDSLLSRKNYQKSITDLQRNRTLGIIYPLKMALSLKEFMFFGVKKFSILSQRLGMRPKDSIESVYFGGGTMFIARSEALYALASLGFSETSFEPELGQLDDTLAHAIERAIGVSVHQGGFGFKEVAPSKKHYMYNRYNI